MDTPKTYQEKIEEASRRGSLMEAIESKDTDKLNELKNRADKGEMIRIMYSAHTSRRRSPSLRVRIMNNEEGI